MLKFRLFGFPVFIHWTFWLVAALISGNLDVNDHEGMQRLLGWMVVVLVSILIHEFGHAFMMRHYGDSRVIVTLHSFGGFAAGSRRLSRMQDIYVSAAGPFVQVTAGVMMWWLIDFWVPQSRLAQGMMKSFMWVSIVWALLNLLPIVPLDGGRISLALFGPRRERAAIILSMVCIGVMAVIAFREGYIYSLFILAMLAFSNFKRLKGEQDDPWMGTR